MGGDVDFVDDVDVVDIRTNDFSPFCRLSFCLRGPRRPRSPHRPPMSTFHLEIEYQCIMKIYYQTKTLAIQYSLDPLEFALALNSSFCFQVVFLSSNF